MIENLSVLPDTYANPITSRETLGIEFVATGMLNGAQRILGAMA
jgi:hypothetical protein